MNNNSATPKAPTKGRIAFAVIIVLAAIIYLAARNFYRFIPSSSNTYNDLQINKTVQGSQVDNIDIVLGNADLILEPSSSDNIEVSISGRTNATFDVSVDNDMLSICQKSDSMFSILEDKKATVLIAIPADYNKDMRLKQASGSSTIREISFDESDITLSSGKMSLEGATFQEFQVVVSSGNFIGTNVTAEETNLKLSSGSLNLAGNLGDSDVKVSSGNMTLEYASQPSDLDINCSSGSVKVDLPDDSDFKLSSSVSSGSLESSLSENKQSENEVFVKLSSGHVSIY